MAELTNKQKKEWAAMLYLKENLTQAEIAEKVGISRQTINKWIKAEKWEERRTGITLTREEQVKHLYRQISELNDNINNRPKGERHATSSEADVIAKLSNAIKKMETDVGIADIISVGTRFFDWLRLFDFEKARDMALLFDGFIKDNLKSKP
ncbi:MAG: putative DNA-binding transcriptional regulator [Clostridiales bacterium]|nr:putative DNA-binding transcriptional regulator [Clostridiales bacterium]